MEEITSRSNVIREKRAVCKEYQTGDILITAVRLAII